MSISDRLDEIEARADAVGIRDDLLPVVASYVASEGLSMQGAIQAGLRLGAETALSDVPRLVAALRAVLDLHSEIWHDGPRCNECSEPELDEPAEWPCPTVRAVEAALGEMER